MSGSARRLSLVSIVPGDILAPSMSAHRLAKKYVLGVPFHGHGQQAAPPRPRVGEPVAGGDGEIDTAAPLLEQQMRAAYR